ncbi:hypothetical protein M758_5G161800 [Ceratodon purpureus]|uniref:DUF7803 domain-containing protein n=1 Tax=Ceratodon purpureus TaxID=3225 RepID=A0A8T0I3P4_CERPU|nr:hypothetical protein KC19_5G169000 [Ceratodon purpureus]KAG0617079.1 hypothetical protein M758_5G161800 [Ceratodon purpureus]
MTEETILTGDDLMMGPPSPFVPPELASHVLDGVESCSTSLRRLFHCLHVNDIEPFCQDHIILYRRCSEQRDTEIRKRIQDAEKKLATTMPEEEARERQAQLKAEAELLERRMILASGVEGVEGFRQRWSIHGRLYDTNKRIESIDLGLESRVKQEPQPEHSKSWWKW